MSQADDAKSYVSFEFDPTQCVIKNTHTVEESVRKRARQNVAFGHCSWPVLSQGVALTHKRSQSLDNTWSGSGNAKSCESHIGQSLQTYMFDLALLSTFSHCIQFVMD